MTTEGLEVLKQNKVKLFSYIIVLEILIIVVMAVILFINPKFGSTNHEIIISSNDDLIYFNDQSIPFTGIMQDTINNKLIVEYEVVNGVKQGQYLLLTLEGNYAVKGFMNMNKNDGNWEYYFDNGQLECTGSFNNDEPTGKWTWFYSDGAIKCEGNFINGKAAGQWIKFDNSGSVNLLINYRAGEVVSIVNIDKVIKV